MASERITPKFLARGNEIGVVSAAVQDGQVSRPPCGNSKRVVLYMFSPTGKESLLIDEKPLATTRRRFGPECLDL